MKKLKDKTDFMAPQCCLLAVTKRRHVFSLKVVGPTVGPVEQPYDVQQG